MPRNAQTSKKRFRSSTGSQGIRMGVGVVAVLIGLTSAGVPATAQRSAGTVPLAAPDGYVVDVPGDWRMYPPAGTRRMATHPMSPIQGQVTLTVSGDAALQQAANAKARSDFQSLPHPGGGTIYFTRKATPPLPTAYSVIVHIGNRAAYFTCNEATGNENGPAGCLNIARSLRFASSAGSTATTASPQGAPAQAVASRDTTGPPAAPQDARTIPESSSSQGQATAPLTSRDGFTVDVPAAWPQGSSGGTVLARERLGGGQVSIRPAERAKESTLRSALARAETGGRASHCVALRDGRACFDDGQIYVRLGERVRTFSCAWQSGQIDTVREECLSIAKTARFQTPTATTSSGTATAPSTTAPASPAPARPPVSPPPTTTQPTVSTDPTRGAPPAPAAPSSPAPRVASPGPSQAETARQRQQQVAQGINDRMAAIRKRNEIAAAVQRDAQSRMQACAQQAATRHPDQSSPSYQQALSVCTENVKRASTCVQRADQTGLNPTLPEYQQSVDACVQDVWK